MLGASVLELISHLKYDKLTNGRTGYRTKDHTSSPWIIDKILVMGYGEKEIDMLDWKMSTYPGSKIIQ